MNKIEKHGLEDLLLKRESNQLKFMLDLLHPREKLAIEFIIFHGLTTKELGIKWEVTQMRAASVFCQGIKNLQVIKTKFDKHFNTGF